MASSAEHIHIAMHELTSDEVLSVLPQWDVGEPLGFPGEHGGTANPAVVVDTTAGRFFLKRRNPRYSAPEMVRHDHALMAHLAAKGLPTPRPLLTREGRTWLESGGAVYELYRYVAGKPHDVSSLFQIHSAGRALALFHLAAEDFVVPHGKAWPRYHDPRRTIEALQWALSEVSELQGSTPGGRTPEAARREISELLHVAKELAATFTDEEYWGCEQITVHGDWHPANLKYEDDEVCGIFDLDWATRQPKLVDIADGVAFFAGRRTNSFDAANIRSLTQPFDLDDSRTRVFLAGYRAVGRVDPAELALLPKFLLARWLWCRADPMRRKVRREEAIDFLLDGIWGPIGQIRAMMGPERP